MPMDVTMPDGTIIRNVPDGTTKAQLQAKLGGATEQPQQEAPLTGFQGRMAEDFAKRKAQVAEAEANQATNTYGISKPLQVVGANAGLVGDTIANVVGSGARYTGDALKGIAGAVLPDDVSIAMAKAAGFGGNAAKDAASEALNDSMLTRGIKAGVEGYKNFATANPEAAANLGAVGNIAANIPLIKPAVKGAMVVGEVGGNLAAAPVKAVGKGVALRAKGYNALAGDDLKALVKAEGNKTTAAYKAVDKTGTVVSKKSVKSLEDKINAKLSETDLDAEFQPKTIAALRVLKNNVKDKATGNGQINLGKLDQFRRLLGRATSPEDKLVAAQLRDVLDNHLDELADTDLIGGTKDSIKALNEARATASRGFAVEKIAKIIQKADGDDNAIRKGFTKFLGDEKNLRGFSEAEKAAFKQASQNTGAQAVEKFLGRFGIDGKGGVLPTLAAGTTAGAGVLAVPAAAPAVIAGSAAKYTRKLAARGDAQKALESVLNRKVSKEDLQKAFEAKKGNR